MPVWVWLGRFIMICFWCIVVDCAVLGCDLLVWFVSWCWATGFLVLCRLAAYRFCVVGFGFGGWLGCVVRFVPFSSCWFGFMAVCMVLMVVFLGCGLQCVLGWWVLVLGAGVWCGLCLGLRSFGWCCGCVVCVIYIADGS